METNFKRDKVLGFAKKNLVLLGIMLILGIFSISNALTKEVVIQDGEKQITIEGYISTAKDALEKAEIKLSEHDQISVAMEKKLESGMTINIKRAYPVTIQVDGEAVEAMTAYNKVSDVLNEYKVELNEEDLVEPSRYSWVDKNDTIMVKRMKKEIVKEKISIPYERVVKYNDGMDKGKLKILQKGEDGQKEVEYKVVYEDGKEITRELIQEKIVAPAQNEIVEQGTAQYIATSRGDTRFKKAIRMSSTAYDATFESTGKNPGDKYYGITRSGTKVRPGVVAVDPKVIPLGTKLYVKSLDGSKDYGFASAEDTGGAIKGNKIDLYFEDPADVEKYGRKKVEVFILD